MQSVIDAIVFSWTVCTRAVARMDSEDVPVKRASPIKRVTPRRTQPLMRGRAQAEYEALMNAFAVLTHECPGCAKCGSSLDHKTLYMQMSMAFCSEKCRDAIWSEARAPLDESDGSEESQYFVGSASRL